MSDISAEQALLLDKVLENMDDTDLNAQLKAMMDEKQAVQEQITAVDAKIIHIKFRYPGLEMDKKLT